MIGDDIEITVVDIRGDKVRLGINAPSKVPVHRKEVYDAIKRENRQAANVKPEEIATVAGAVPNNVPAAPKEFDFEVEVDLRNQDNINSP
jgi:carbon storage regulator